MKIRTDFVTNSSSSSFCTVRIKTSSKELMELIETMLKCTNAESKNKDEDTIEFSKDDYIYGF